MTKYQSQKVQRSLEKWRSGKVVRSPATREHSSPGQFPGEIRAQFSDLERAKAALKEIGKLNLGRWAETWVIQDAETGEVVFLPESDIEEINTPKTLDDLESQRSADGKPSRHQLWHTLLRRQNYRCYICGLSWSEQVRRYERSFDIHRVVPGRKQGGYTLENTIMVCPECHQQIDGWSWEEVHLLRDRLRGNGTD